MPRCLNIFVQDQMMQNGLTLNYLPLQSVGFDTALILIKILILQSDFHTTVSDYGFSWYLFYNSITYHKFFLSYQPYCDDIRSILNFVWYLEFFDTLYYILKMHLMMTSRSLWISWNTRIWLKWQRWMCWILGQNTKKCLK